MTAKVPEPTEDGSLLPKVSAPTESEPVNVVYAPGVELGRAACTHDVQIQALLARRQTVLLIVVAGIVIALVALGVSPYVAVSTAFGAGLAAIELQRRAG